MNGLGGLFDDAINAVANAIDGTDTSSADDVPPGMWQELPDPGSDAGGIPSSPGGPWVFGGDPGGSSGGGGDFGGQGLEDAIDAGGPDGSGPNLQTPGQVAGFLGLDPSGAPATPPQPQPQTPPKTTDEPWPWWYYALGAAAVVGVAYIASED